MDLLRQLLHADPAQRPTAADVLAHPWVASVVPVLPAKPLSIRIHASPTTPLNAEDGGADSPGSSASTTSNVSFASTTPVHADQGRGLRNWWALQSPWPPAQRAVSNRPPRPGRVPSYVVLPACMHGGSRMPQFDVRGYAAAMGPAHVHDVLHVPKRVAS